ncbi:MAG: ATP-grasp domain-containing protein [Elusimicrobia bacterium]|nr:ATP-grasp domain-containing protein [Elusimicrobiota bacterium]
MSESHAGRAFVDRFYKVPAAGDENYIQILNDLSVAAGVDAVIPASEPEIFALSGLNPAGPPILPSKIPVIAQNGDFVKIHGDKLECFRNLARHVDVAPFADGADPRQLNDFIVRYGFPLVIKERRSSGSRRVSVIENRSALDQQIAQFQAPVVQAYVDDKEGEFSVGVFSSPEFIQAVAFRRSLGPGGNSWYAELSDDEDVLAYALNIAKSIKISGSVNIQVRKGAMGVKLLEINPRFSSLAAARAACGFKDVEWSLMLALGCLSVREPQPVRLGRFCRFQGELMDFGEGFSAVKEWEPYFKIGACC